MNSCQHGDNLGVACKLRREEDHGDEDEERREQIGEVGDEVRVVVEHNGFQRCVILRELCQVLVHVEHDGDGDNQDDGEEIGADELLDDIPVEPFDEGGLELLQQTTEPAEVLLHPSAELQKSAAASYLSVFHFSLS